MSSIKTCLILFSLITYSCSSSKNKVISNVSTLVVYLDSSTFNSKQIFEEKWNMLYPWGRDHNGTARMLPSNVTLKCKGVLQIEANWLHFKNEGISSSDPHLKIAFHSGAIHAKQKIKVTKEQPYWVISGDFKAPTAPSSWPAFWITGSDSWPPEVDILEFKGSSINWQNTVTGPSWDKTEWTTEKFVLEDANSVWHNYKLILERINNVDTNVKMFIDNQLVSTEIKDYTNKPFWLIINLQMEGASGETNSNSLVRRISQKFLARNIYLATMRSK